MTGTTNKVATFSVIIDGEAAELALKVGDANNAAIEEIKGYNKGDLFAYALAADGTLAADAVATVAIDAKTVEYVGADYIVVDGKIVSLKDVELYTVNFAKNNGPITVAEGITFSAESGKDGNKIAIITEDDVVVAIYTKVVEQ